MCTHISKRGFCNARAAQGGSWGTTSICHVPVAMHGGTCVAVVEEEDDACWVSRQYALLNSHHPHQHNPVAAVCLVAMTMYVVEIGVVLCLPPQTLHLSHAPTPVAFKANGRAGFVVHLRPETSSLGHCSQLRQLMDIVNTATGPEPGSSPLGACGLKQLERTNTLAGAHLCSSMPCRLTALCNKHTLVSGVTIDTACKLRDHHAVERLLC